MVTKTRFTPDGTTRVAFELSEPSAQRVVLAGNFNGWSEPIPMTRGEDGIWRASLDLEPDHQFEFRYVIDDKEWINESQPDGYVPNPYGSANCLLQT
jgi:1,4-alpha-glucan branching enzyme